MKGGRRKGVFSRVRRAAKSVRKGVKKAGRAIGKKVGKEALRRGVMAARRAADFGIKAVPIAGNVYSIADFGVKATRAARKGKFKKFMAKEAIKGIAQAAAPQAFAAYEAREAQKGVMDAITKGKGVSRTTKSKMIIARRKH